MIPWHEYSLLSFGRSREPVPAIIEGAEFPRAVMLVRADIARSYGSSIEDPQCRAGVLINGRRYFAYWRPGADFKNDENGKMPRGAYRIEYRASEHAYARQVQLEGANIALGAEPW